MRLNTLNILPEISLHILNYALSPNPLAYPIKVRLSKGYQSSQPDRQTVCHGCKKNWEDEKANYDGI